MGATHSLFPFGQFFNHTKPCLLVAVVLISLCAGYNLEKYVCLHLQKNAP